MATSAALGVLVLATLGVVASAVRRMDLYVEAFGLTRLRLLVSVFELCLGVVLVLVLLAGVRWRAGWQGANLGRLHAADLLRERPLTGRVPSECLLGLAPRD